MCRNGVRRKKHNEKFTTYTYLLFKENVKTVELLLLYHYWAEPLCSHSSSVPLLSECAGGAEECVTAPWSEELLKAGDDKHPDASVTLHLGEWKSEQIKELVIHGMNPTHTNTQSTWHKMATSCYCTIQ